MHYYIDGYNIIFRVLHTSEALQLQREALIYDLSYKASLFNLNLTLVFDSHYQEGESTKSHLDSLEIIYTSKGESADEYIIKAIKHGVNPKRLVVVTSDNHLAWKVRSLSGKAEPAEEFMERLQKRFKNHLQGVEPSEETELFKQPEVDSSLNQPSSTASLEMPTLIRTPQKSIIKIDPESQTPIKSSLPEECFEYYKEAFEEEFETLQSQDFPTLIVPPLSEETAPSKLTAKKEKAEKMGHIEEKLSDSERWLQTFEKNKDKRSLDDEGFEPL